MRRLVGYLGFLLYLAGLLLLLAALLAPALYLAFPWWALLLTVLGMALFPMLAGPAAGLLWILALVRLFRSPFGLSSALLLAVLGLALLAALLNRLGRRRSIPA